jgi:hypothetical protein
MRKLLSLLAVAVSVVFLGVLSASPAGALGGESLGCRVSPGGTSDYANPCSGYGPAGSYLGEFQVLNGTGTYSYAWTVLAGQAIVGGCTSTTSYCQVTTTVQNGGAARIKVSVQLTQGGASETLTALAWVTGECYINGNYC